MKIYYTAKIFIASQKPVSGWRVSHFLVGIFILAKVLVKKPGFAEITWFLRPT